MRRRGTRATRFRYLIAPGGALALLLLGLPWVLGASAQRAYQGLLEEFLSALPPGSVLAEDYERGWFRSTAGLALALQPQPGAGDGEALRLRIESEVEQGPLHWLDFSLPPAWLRIQSRVELPDHPLSPPPLLVTTDLAADGSSLSRFHLDPGESAGAGYRLRHAGLRGSLRLRHPSGPLGLVLDLPETELISPTGNVGLIQALRLTLELSASPPEQGGPGGTALLWSARAETDVQAEGHLDSLGALQGERPLDLHLTLTTAAARLGDQVLGPTELTINAQRLDLEAIRETAAALGALSGSALPQAVRGLMGATLLARLLPRLAPTRPRITLDPVRTETPEGVANARLELSMEPLAETQRASGRDPTPPANWLAGLRAEGEMDLSEPLARRWLGRSDPHGFATDQGSSASPLDPWLRSGRVSLREGHILSGFRFGDGLLTLNGQTFPVPGLPAILSR